MARRPTEQVVYAIVCSNYTPPEVYALYEKEEDAEKALAKASKEIESLRIMPMVLHLHTPSATIKFSKRKLNTLKEVAEIAKHDDVYVVGPHRDGSYNELIQLHLDYLPDWERVTKSRLQDPFNHHAVIAIPLSEQAIMGRDIHYYYVWGDPLYFSTQALNALETLNTLVTLLDVDLDKEKEE